MSLITGHTGGTSSVSKSQVQLRNKFFQQVQFKIFSGTMGKNIAYHQDSTCSSCHLISQKRLCMTIKGVTQAKQKHNVLLVYMCVWAYVCVLG